MDKHADLEKEIQRLQKIVDHQNNQIFILRSVLDSLSGSVYWKDIQGRYLGRNYYSVARMNAIEFEYDLNKDAVVGKTDYDFFSKKVADQYRKHDLQVMKTGKELTIEEPIHLPNGKTMCQLSVKKPLYNRDGKIVGVVGNTIDISYLKEVEGKLLAAEQRANEADKIKAAFMQNMQHDFRTAFTGISELAEYLYNQETDTEKKSLLHDIVDSGKELLNYCNEVVLLSEAESHKRPIEERKFDLLQLVESIIKTEKPAARLNDLTFDYHFDENLPKIILGDKYRIYAILINLVSNAIKFTQQGHVELRVLLLKQIDKHAIIRFIICDTGVGIPRDKQDYIFQKFTRLVPSNKNLYRGLGVGLSIVKTFMNELEGEIDIQSDANKGTTFMCTIPFRIPLSNDPIQ